MSFCKFSILSVFFSVSSMMKKGLSMVVMSSFYHEVQGEGQEMYRDSGNYRKE